MRDYLSIICSSPSGRSEAERVWYAGYSTGKADATRGVYGIVEGDNRYWRAGYDHAHRRHDCQQAMWLDPV